MSALSIEMLTAQRVAELWPQLEPMFQAACDANPIAKDEFNAGDIFVLTQLDLAAVFAGFDDGELACMIALQFNNTNGHKGVDVIAMAGRSLLKFRTAYWNLILDWLRANAVEFVDAYVPEKLARLYRQKFGFNKSCAYVRMNLKESSHEQIC